VSRLTPREREVAALLSEGLSNKEIGCHLGIAEDTAKHHVGKVMEKLGVCSRTEAAVMLVRQELAAEPA
jgi:DNA-binding NarL/FixJ family response regulator